MNWKERVNLVLSRTSKHRLVSVQADERRKQNAKSKINSLQQEVDQLQEKLRSRRRTLPSDYDSEFTELWPQVSDRTMTSHEKLFALYQATNYITRYQIPGAIVECGVWRGGSMLTVAHTLQCRNSLNRDLFLFDTFSGMSEPTERDYNYNRKQSAASLLEELPKTSHVWAVASLEDVQEGFANLAYPKDRIHFIKGKVEDTIPSQAPKQIAILRLDTDWYESTKHELNHLYDRLVPGGVLIIDDYGTWQGAREATHEFLDEIGDPLLFIRATHGRIAVKPGGPITQ